MYLIHIYCRLQLQSKMHQKSHHHISIKTPTTNDLTYNYTTQHSRRVIIKTNRKSNHGLLFMFNQSYNDIPTCDIDNIQNQHSQIQRKNMCKHQITSTCANLIGVVDLDVVRLVYEIERNLDWNITPRNICCFINSQQKTKYNSFMKQHNLQLSQTEYISIKLWTLSETLTQQYHLDCSENKSAKWLSFIKALTGGIIKIYKAMIINTLYDNKNKIFPSIPISLYRGTKVFDP
eukprot:247668_1